MDDTQPDVTSDEFLIEMQAQINAMLARVEACGVDLQSFREPA